MPAKRGGLARSESRRVPTRAARSGGRAIASQAAVAAPIPLAEPTAATATVSFTGRTGSAKIAVVTVLDDELAAAKHAFGAHVNIPGTAYYVAAVHPEHRYEVVVTQTAGRTQVPASESVQPLVEHFEPAAFMLVGIAGGISDRDGVTLGDVVVADYVDYYEHGKLERGKYLVRREPADHPSLYLRTRFVDPQRQTDSWRGHINKRRPKKGRPKIVVGNVVSGEKVLGDRNNSYQKRILRVYDKALAVDMESWGFGRAVFVARSRTAYNPQYLVIRGISDLIDKGPNTPTRKKWAKYAASAAAAFARSVADAILPHFLAASRSGS